MNPNGSFNFLPATGFTGVDSFNYTISDGLATDTGTVLITINERVWYVNPAAVGSQTGPLAGSVRDHRSGAGRLGGQ